MLLTINARGRKMKIRGIDLAACDRGNWTQSTREMGLGGFSKKEYGTKIPFLSLRRTYCRLFRFWEGTRSSSLTTDRVPENRQGLGLV